MKKFILSLFLCCVSVFSFATTYYSISASGSAVDATLLSSWTNNASGVGGTAPTSFIAAGNSWIAQTSAGLTVSHTWSLLGSLQVGCPLTITATASLSGAITVNSGGTLTLTTGGTFSPTNDLTNNGTLVISSGTTLNMGTYAISGTGSFTNNGTITTASTSSTPLPSGVSWGGTVQYTASLLQILTAGTYNNLSVKGCSASGDITVTGNFTTASSYSSDMGSNALSVAGTITNAGIIKTSNISSTPLPTGKSWSGTVNYYGNGQTVVAGTYATLSLSTSSGSVTASAGGNIKVTSAFTSTAFNTLDMGTNVLSGTPATLTNGGILITAVPTSVSSAPIISKPWGGTVIYNGVTQTIVAQTYNNLSSTGAGTNTAGGALTVSGLLTIGSGNTLKMSTYNLSVGSVSNSGTVQTSGSNSITKTIPWDGTVQYSSLSGGQVVNGTYSNLTLSNTTGTNTAHGNIVVTGNFTTTSGGTLDMTTYYTLNVSSATINNNGTIKTGTPTSISASPITPGMVWGGTIQYSTNGAYVTAVTGTYNNLTISTGVHAGGNITVNGALNVTSYLYLGNFVLDGSLTSITIGGTLETSVPTTTSSVPLPANRAWTGGGNVLYDAPLGGQTIVAGTYDNLKVYTTGSGSTANTAGGDLTINNNLYAPYTGTLDLTSYVLKGSFSAHYGAATIKTQNTSVHPIPSNIYIGFNFQYNNPAGGQTIVPGTYATLTNSNTSGVNTLSGNVSVSGNCSLSAGSNLNNNGHDMALTRNLLGSGTETGSGTITLNGNDSTIYTIGGVTVSNLSLSIPTPSRTKGQYYLGGNLTVTNTLTLGANLDLDSNNLILPVGASLAGSFSNQTMLITCCSGLVQQYKNGTGSLTFPVGDSFYNYTPIVIDLTGGTFTPGSSYVGVNVSNTKNPSNANTTNYLNRYWDVVTSGITSPVYDLTSAQYLVGDITGTESSINTGQYIGSLPWVRFDAANTGTHQLTGTGLSGSNTAITGLSNSNPTVSASPSSITICNGSSTVLTVAASTGDPTLSYSWAPGTTLSASTGSSVTASPTSNQVYTLTVTDGNGNTATSTCTVNIDNIPNVGTVTGSGITCLGNLDSVYDATADAGGTWLSSNTSIATIDPVTGYITGVAQGTSTISYSFTNTCGTFAATAIETITAPTAITGAQYVCVGLTTTLSSSPAGNTWSSSNTGVATVDPSSGVVTGVSAGTVVISYAINSSPCFVTAIVTVNALPIVTFSSAPGANICASANVTYTTQAGQSNYIWTVPGVLNTDYTVSSGGTSTTDNTVTLQWLTTGSQTVTINYSNSHGCTAVSATSNSTTVNSRPSVTFTTSPGANVCSSTDVIYTTQAGQSNYVWSVPGILNTDYTITSGGISSTDNTVTLQWLTAGSQTVTVNYNNSNGCNALSAASNTTNVNARPTVTFTSSPGANTCASSTIIYTTQASESNYLWSVPGVLNTDYTISSGGVSTSDNTVTLQWLTAGSKTVTINYTDINTCTALSATSSNTTVHALPVVTFTASPGANTCVSSDVAYTTQSSESSYIWSVSGSLSTDYTISSGGTSTSDNTVTLQWLTTGSQTVTINYTDGNGCTALSSTSNSTTVNARPTPTFTASPGANICSSVNVTYTTQSGQSSYVWSVPGVLNTDYTIMSGGISSADNTVTLQWLTSGSKTVTVNYNNSNSCNGLSAASSTTNVNTSPSATFTASPGANSCASNDIVYTTQSGQTNYIWSVPGVLNTDYTISSGGVSSTDNTVTLQWLTSGSKTVTVNYSNSSSCSSIANASNTTTVHALPVVTFTTAPGANTCASNNVTYTTQSSESSYVWSVPGVLNTDYTISSGGVGSGSNTVTLQWLTTGSQTVTINYTDANSCTALSSTSNTTTVHALPVVTFTSTPGANTCASATVTYTTQSSESGYVWNVPGTLSTDYTISSGGIGSGSNTVTLQWLTAGSKSVTINYTDANNCMALSPTSNTTSVHALPVVTFTSSAAANTCASNNVTYTTQSGESGYVWSVPGVLSTDYTISSGGTGSGSNTVTLQWLTAGSKSVTINYTDANSCTALSSTSNTTSVHLLPIVSFTATPTSNTCASNDVTYATQSGESGYVWSVPGVVNTDYTISSGGTGSGSNTVTLKWLTAGSKSVTINYTDANSCTALSSTSNSTTVHALPGVSFTSTPASTTCASSSVTYTTQSGQSSYVWNVPGTLSTDYTISSGGTGSGSNTVTLKWLTAGSKAVTINYTDANNCTALSAASNTTTVNALPVVSFVSPPTATSCLSTNYTYQTQSSETSYVWNVPGVLNTDYTVSSGGTTSGSNTVTLQWLTTGSKTVTINYTDANGCTALAATTNTTSVNPLPNNISCNTLACVGGATITASDVTTGGTWSSSNSSATINSSTGVISGISAGFPTIDYTLATGCFKSFALTVRASPAAISGIITICPGATLNLTDANAGGSWVSSTTSVATIGSGSGIVSGITTGTTTITYTYLGCTTTQSLTVSGTSISPITGILSLCNQATTSLADATGGGSWSSSNTSIATVDVSTGVVTGVAPGNASISYSASGCFSVVTATINVPASITYSGTGNVCTSNTLALSDATNGGTWLSTATSVATINASGVVTPVAPGPVTISYTKGSCSVTTALSVSNNPLSAISAPSGAVCNGNTMTLSDTHAGGVWSSNSPGIATIGSSNGVIATVSPGSVTFLYTESSCYVSKIIFVGTPLPSITGSSLACIGQTTSLSNSTSGGSWYSSTTLKATVGTSTGVVTGVATGNVTISYALTGCTVTLPMTVNSVPASITGTASLCASGSTTLHDVTAGGTWSSSNAGLATVDASTGVVSGAGAGNPLISYTVTSTGCYSTVTLTVNPCRFGNEISNGNNNGINEYEQNYVIYPNPSTGQLNFVQSIIDNVTIPVKIINYVGAIVYDDKIEFSGGNAQLNLNNAIPGIYLVEISISPGTKQVFKLVIEK